MARTVETDVGTVKGSWTMRLAPFVLGYAAASILSLHLRVATGASALWVANAVLISGLLLLDRRSRPVFAALCCLSAMIISPLVTGRFGPTFLTYLAFNVIESVAIAWLARRLCGPRLDFSQWRQLALLAVGAVVPVCAATAVLGGEVIERISPLPAHRSLWFESHALGAMIVVPAITLIARPHRSFPFSVKELAAAMAAFTLFTVAVFTLHSTKPVLFLMFPAMILMAFRYGPVGASLGMMTAGLLAVYFVFADARTFTSSHGANLLERIELMQAFLAVLFFTALPVAGAVATSARMKLLFQRRSQVARQARQKAERASKARAEFLANMSHEIRTPLNGVLGLADGLSRTELNPEQRDMLKMILTSGKALTGLLSDALDLTRADSGQLEIVREPFQIRDLVREAAFPFEHLAQVKGLSFETRFDDDLPAASVGDPLRVRQILANLISNAIKFTSTGGVSVEVGCAAGPDGQRRLKVCVRDTGIGLDGEMKARLFRRFEQGDSSVTRRYGGCGLGLSIAHKLAEMMEGDLACDSEPGQGATFTFSLPLVEVCALPHDDDASAAATEYEPAKLRVLLAEDHPVNQKVVQALLGDTVELTMVGDGQAAVEAVKGSDFDVVLMDTHMPVMDGLSAIRAIRAWERQQGLKPMPIVSLTADAMPQQIEAATAAGADLHLAKPISGDSLARTLEESQTLERRKAEPTARAG